MVSNVSFKLLDLPACDGVECECKIDVARCGACFVWSRVLLWGFCSGDFCDDLSGVCCHCNCVWIGNL